MKKTTNTIRELTSIYVDIPESGPTGDTFDGNVLDRATRKSGSVPTYRSAVSNVTIDEGGIVIGEYESFVGYVKTLPSSRVKYISINGSNIRGRGTRSSPWLTAHYAYSQFGVNGETAPMSYIIALDGEYTPSTLRAASAEGGTLADNSRKTLFFGNRVSRKKNMTILSENLGGCKLIGSVQLEEDTSYTVVNNIKKYKFNANDVHYSAGLTLFDFDLFGYTFDNKEIKNSRPYVIVPSMHGRTFSDIDNVEAWQADIETYSVTGITLGSKSISYATVFNGVAGTAVGCTTHWSSVMRGITTRNAMDVIAGATTQWENSSLAIHGGNNNYSKLLVLGVCYDNPTIYIKGNLPYDIIEEIGFFGRKSFIGSTGEMSWEHHENPRAFYAKTEPITTLRCPVIKRMIDLSLVENLTIMGFDIGEFSGAVVESTGTALTTAKSKNIKFTHNRIHDCVLGGIQISFSENTTVSKNAIYRTHERPCQVANSPNSIVTNNLFAFWRSLSGVYYSGQSGGYVGYNNFAILGGAHGNGMACYLGCSNITIEHNFFFCPYNISLAIQQYSGGTFKIENNVMYGGHLKIYEPIPRGGTYTEDPGSTKFIIKNNALHLINDIADCGITHNNAWWMVNNLSIRNNFLYNTASYYTLGIDLLDTSFPGSGALSGVKAASISRAVAGVSGPYVLGTTHTVGPTLPYMIRTIPAELANSFSNTRIFAHYTGVCGATQWTHSWLPGVTLEGGGTSYGTQYAMWSQKLIDPTDNLPRVYNNLHMYHNVATVLSSSLGYTGGFVKLYDYNNSQIKSQLLRNDQISSSLDMNHPAILDTLEKYLVDPTANSSGFYDWRLKSGFIYSTGNTGNSNTPATTPFQTGGIQKIGIGVDWIGPSFKGLSYEDQLTANFIDWWKPDQNASLPSL